MKKPKNRRLEAIKLLSALGFAASANLSYAYATEEEANLTEQSVAEYKIKRWSDHKPWREPQDTTTALNNPDLYAWQLFVALNWPADINNCTPDQGKWLGQDGTLVWETWREKRNTFLDGAQKPQSWQRDCKNGVFTTLPEGEFSVIEDEGVYMNRLQYNYIRDNQLYSLDQQERLVRQGVKDLEFPLGSKSVKSSWVVINESDKPRYHWRETVKNGATVIYGLSAIHIVSKDSPSWFWSTFEHEDNQHRWPQVYPTAFLGWQVPSKDSASCPADNLSCNEIPQGFYLEGTKWQHFRLRGTQTDWVDSRGQPTILTNSRIEYLFDQQTMSCINCHAIAVKGEHGGAAPILGGPGTLNDQGLWHGYTGTVDPNLFKDENGVLVPYLGLDYVWALRNAKREAQ